MDSTRPSSAHCVASGRATPVIALLALAACGTSNGPRDATLGDSRALDGTTNDTVDGSNASDAMDGADGAMHLADAAHDASPDVSDAADGATPSGCATHAARPTLTVDQFLGVNGVFNDVSDHDAPFGSVREYHDWEWDEGNGDTSYPGYPHNQNKFDPSYPAPDWHFDAFYSGLAARSPSVMVSPCLIGSAVGWLTPTASDIPVRAGADPTLPSSFVEHADHLFQYAARYGRTVVADGLLKLASDQARRTGLGVVGYYEDGNEPDSWWISDPMVTFTAAEYAAMASADYDGDCGSMGTTVGVRNADPNARMAMAGLSSDAHNTIDLAFLDGIKTWSDAHRHGSFPADVINVHHYSNDGTQGTSPEADQLRTRLEAVAAWRDANAPGLEIWLSEFGWDTNASSPQRAPSIGTNDATIVQGAWIVRAYMAALAAGIDRAFVFMLTDSDEGNATQFSSAGLVWHGSGLPAGVNDLDPKPSWYFVSTLHARLAGMAFHGEIASGDPNVTVYALRAIDGHGAYVLWCPTSNDTHVNGYALALAGSPTTATGVTLADGSATGNEAALAIAGGRVMVDVGEVPMLVMVDAMP